MNIDFSEWEFDFGPDLTLRQIASEAGSIVAQEIQNDLCVSLDPGFDFDDDRRYANAVFLSASSLDGEISSGNDLLSVALDACHGDKMRAKFIAACLREVAGKLEATI
jgi:hypothetical protein